MILDAEVSIPNFIFLRADRDSHSSCAARVWSDLSPELVESGSNAWVDTLIFEVKTLDAMVVLHYRPPDCSKEKFDDALNICKEAIEETTNGDSRILNILDFGDYNFPSIKVHIQKSSESKNQFEDKK